MENELFSEKEYYRQKIIEMVGKIDNVKFLRRIYISLTEYLKEEKPE